MGLGPQVFLLRPNQEFDESKLRSVRIDKSEGWNKPKGGFWTSTLEGRSTAWLDWCRWEMPQWIGDRAALFDVRSGANIYMIRTASDYYDLWAAYPQPSMNRGYRDDKYVAWWDVARDYDGVHLASDLGRGGAPELYGWDVESSVWFKPGRALEFVKMVDVEQGEKGPDDDEWHRPECVLRVADRYLTRR